MDVEIHLVDERDILSYRNILDTKPVDESSVILGAMHTNS
jgi:hypothetical protein